jgi:hypothetical protein
MKNDVLINIRATDNASETVKRTARSFESAQSSIGSSLKRVAGIATAVTASITAIGTATYKLASDSAKNMEVSRYFFKTFGDEATGSLERLREASKGTVSDINLMEASNRASLLGVTNSTETLAKIMEVARLRGKAMGLSTTQAFNDIVTGIGRGSPLILDNLGIKIPDAFKEMTKEMSSAQKTQELVNLVLKDGAEISKELGGDVLTAGDRFEIMQSKMANLKQEIGEKLIPIATALMEKVIVPLVNKLSELPNKIEGVINFFRDFGKEAKDTSKKIKEDLTESLETFSGKSEEVSTKLSEVLKTSFADPVDDLNVKLTEFNDETSMRTFQVISEVAPAFETAGQSVDIMTQALGDPKVGAIKRQQEFRENLEENVKFIKGVWNEAIDGLKQKWEEVKIKLQELGITQEDMHSMWMTLSDILTIVVASAIKLLFWLLERLLDVIGWQIEKINALKQIWEGITNFWNNEVIPVLKKVSEWLDKIFDKDGESIDIDIKAPKIQYTPMQYETPQSFQTPVRTQSTLQGFANGGSVLGGTPIVVGEQGPELFVPSANGDILPNGGGGMTLNVNVGMYAGNETERRRIAEKLYESLVELAQGQGKSVAQLMGA